MKGQYCVRNFRFSNRCFCAVWEMLSCI